MLVNLHINDADCWVYISMQAYSVGMNETAWALKMSFDLILEYLRTTSARVVRTRQKKLNFEQAHLHITHAR